MNIINTLKRGIVRSIRNLVPRDSAKLLDEAVNEALHNAFGIVLPPAEAQSATAKRKTRAPRAAKTRGVQPEQAILQHVTTEPEPVATIAERSGLETKQAAKALAVLVKGKAVKKTGVKRGTRYQLAA